MKFRIATAVTALRCCHALVTPNSNVFMHSRVVRTALHGMPLKEPDVINGEKINGESNGIGEEVINGQVETVKIDTSVAVNEQNQTDQASTDLTTFFENIFQPYAPANTGINSDIQRSIQSLSEAQTGSVDLLDLTVDFANEVYRNISTTSSNGENNGHVSFESMAHTSLEDVPAEVTNSITNLFSQLEVALDERFVEFCEEIAFYDTEGLRSDDVKPGPTGLLEEDYERRRRERIGKRSKDSVELDRTKDDAFIKPIQKDGATYMNEVALTSKRMRTREIMRNFNVAPIYYTIALFMRWAQKATVPPMAMLMFLTGLAYPLKWRDGGQVGAKERARKRMRLFGGKAVIDTTSNARTKKFNNEEVPDEEFIQGWKRTGEIAAKGKRGRAWATLRRSAEIWFYFSSFYIKDAWILKNYDGGRWSKERFTEERGKLGAQLTQNLLKLGPTFIKVCLCDILCSWHYSSCPRKYAHCHSYH